MGLKVMGIGGCGRNILALLAKQKVGAELIYADGKMDRWIEGIRKIQLHRNNINPILDILQGNDPLLIAFGLGGNSGEIYMPEILRFVQSRPNTFFFVVKPFSFEGVFHLNNAEKEMQIIRESGVRYMVRDNQEMEKLGDKISFMEALQKSLEIAPLVHALTWLYGKNDCGEENVYGGTPLSDVISGGEFNYTFTTVNGEEKVEKIEAFLRNLHADPRFGNVYALISGRDISVGESLDLARFSADFAESHRKFVAPETNENLFGAPIHEWNVIAIHTVVSEAAAE